MADFEIIKRTIGGVDDKRVLVDNLHPPLVRKMAIGDDWNALRIGMRLSIRRASNWTSPPKWFFGLSHNRDIPATPSCRHALCVAPFTNNMSYSTGIWGERISYGDAGSNQSRLYLFENGAETIGITSTGGINITANATNGLYDGAALILNITKGSPWIIEKWCHRGGNNLNLIPKTADWFREAMGSTGVPSGAYSDTASDFTPDEVTYGALDSICFVFLGSIDGFEVSDIAYSKLA